MRVLMRLLAPLLGLALAAAGVLVVIEVVVAWVRTPATRGLLVPWHDWRAALDAQTWDAAPVPVVAICTGAAGLLLLLVALLARRHDIVLDGPAEDVTVTTSPRVLARLVGRRVRAGDDVAAATVTASRRRISVATQGWNDDTDGLRAGVTTTVHALLDEVPLHRRPRVGVTAQRRRGVR